MEHNEIGTGGQESSTAYTLHGRPLAVGTRLSGPESWGKDRVYLVTELKMDHGPVAVVQAYPDPGVKYIIRLDHKSVYLWEVVEPTLNDKIVDAGSWLVDSYGSYGRVQSWAWESDGVLRLDVSVYGQSSVPIAVRVWPDGTNQQWSLWAPKVSGEPIAVGDWIRIDEPCAPNVGVFRIVKLWPTPVDGPTRRLDVAATFEHGSYRSTRRLGDGTDGPYKARKLHPQDPSVRPVIGDLVKHPVKDVIGKITDIYGEFDRYVSVEWLGTQQGVHTHTDYHWNWARRAEQPLVLLRSLEQNVAEELLEQLNDVLLPAQECVNTHPAYRRIGPGIFNFKPTQRVRELEAIEKAANTPMDELHAPSMTKFVNYPGTPPEDVKLKKGDRVYAPETGKEGTVDHLTKLRDHSPVAVVNLHREGGTTSLVFYDVDKLRRSAGLGVGAIVADPDGRVGVVIWVDRGEYREYTCVRFNDGWRYYYSSNDEDVFKLKRIGVTYIENSEPQEHKCVADQVCAPAVGAEVDAGTGGSLSNAELSAQTAWKPFPQYLPEKKGKYLVHFVEFGDCKVIRWKGTRWAKYNDSVSSFYTVPIEEIVPFVGAVSAPALTEQQLNELDPPEFKVGDTVYDPVSFPGKTGEVVEVTPGGLFPVRVQFGPKSTAAYTNNGRYQLNDFRRLTHIPYKPGYITTQ